MPLNVLIIDDENDIGLTYKNILGQRGMEVRFATEPEEGLLLMRYTPDIVLLDYLMPRMDGIEVLKRIREDNPNQLVIMMTAHGTVDNAVEAMKLGAFHYIRKPFKTDDLIALIDKAREIIDMRKHLQLSEVKSETGDFGLLDGKSQVMKEVFKRAGKVANISKTSVLILGESGTGKEMLARTIHNLSDRKDKTFIALNCSAIPHDLLESELFGYEPGAFTGANRRKLGMFEMADKGTLFLDEIGDMPLELQSKILRVLQDNSFYRLGSEKALITVDVRVIAASNRKLEDLIAESRFREDLFYRLNTFTITMPPLRERRDDVIQLALKFIDIFNREMKTNIAGLSTEAARAIKSFHWPGNVRQLRNAIESSMIECDSDYIQPEDLPQVVRSGGSGRAEIIAQGFIESGIPTLEDVKSAYILKVLGQCKTDQEAADILDVSRRTITRFKKEMTSN